MLMPTNSHGAPSCDAAGPLNHIGGPACCLTSVVEWPVRQSDYTREPSSATSSPDGPAITFRTRRVLSLAQRLEGFQRQPPIIGGADGPPDHESGIQIENCCQMQLGILANHELGRVADPALIRCRCA